MKKTIFIYFFLLNAFCPAQSDTLMILRGTYKGKNIYIHNPTSGPVKNCIKKVLLNGKEIPFNPATTFMLRLDSLNFKAGDTLRLCIVHEQGCRPYVLNDNTDAKNRTLMSDPVVEEGGTICWYTSAEAGYCCFAVQEYKWNRWVTLKEFDGEGAQNRKNSYMYKPLYHSGNNKFRIKQSGNEISTLYSGSVEFDAGVKKVTIKGDPNKIANSIEFTATTNFELYDENGNIVKKGTAQSIGCADLKRGNYFLNFDSEMTQITKFY